MTQNNAVFGLLFEYQNRINIYNIYSFIPFSPVLLIARCRPPFAQAKLLSPVSGPDYAREFFYIIDPANCCNMLL